jgi:hypothetical protein
MYPPLLRIVSSTLPSSCSFVPPFDCTGAGGYSAGVITAVAVAVAVAIAVSTPGDDYDPSNGWIAVQDVPTAYDQQIVQQVCGAFRTVRRLCRLHIWLAVTGVSRDIKPIWNLPSLQYFVSRPVIVARRSLRVAWSALSWGSGLGVDYLRGARCDLVPRTRVRFDQ